MSGRAAPGIGGQSVPSRVADGSHRQRPAVSRSPGAGASGASLSLIHLAELTAPAVRGQVWERGGRGRALVPGLTSQSGGESHQHTSFPSVRASAPEGALLVAGGAHPGRDRCPEPQKGRLRRSVSPHLEHRAPTQARPVKCSDASTSGLQQPEEHKPHSNEEPGITPDDS